MSCRHYIVEGRVQGVFFRASTEEMAIQLNLMGWVRNLIDGRVEVVACGEEEQLQAFEAWIRQGPPLARVSQVDVKVWTGPSGFDDFSIR